MTLSVIWPTSGAQYIFIDGGQGRNIYLESGWGRGGAVSMEQQIFSPIQYIHFQPPVFNLSPYFKSIMILFCPLTIKLVYISPLIPLYVNPSVRPCNIIKRIVLNICQFCCFQLFPSVFHHVTFLAVYFAFGVQFFYFLIFKTDIFGFFQLTTFQ